MNGSSSVPVSVIQQRRWGAIQRAWDCGLDYLGWDCRSDFRATYPGGDTEMIKLELTEGFKQKLFDLSKNWDSEDLISFDTGQN